MRYFVKLLMLVAMMVCGAATAQTVSVLPNAMTQFVDGNGAPYAGGLVYMYVPYTTTPKVTFQDPNGVSLNQNPITLDANGRAVIWGSGEYRQVLQDLNGVTVWDQLTYASPTSAGGGSGSTIWYGAATGTANAITLSTPAGFVGTDGQSVGFIANASNTGSTTINASGFGSLLVEKNTNTGPATLVGSEIVSGNLEFATYSGSLNVFILSTTLPPPGIGLATSLASAATVDLGTVASHNANISGVTTITSFGNSANTSYPLYLVQFSGALQITESAAIITPGGTNITTAVGDSAWVLYVGGGNWQILQYMPVTPTAVVPQPQFRLSTTSGNPISTASGTGVATVYAVPYSGNLIPLWNGVAFVTTACPQLSNVLANSAVGNAGPAAAVAASVYDLVAWNNAGTCTLTRDVAWTSVTTPAVGDAFARVNGVLVNSVSITNGPAAGYGTFLGTIATDAGGVTVTFNPTPAAASGGPANGAWVGLWNEFNRIPVSATAQDSESTWSYGSSTWHAVDASNNNRITYVAGRAEDSFTASYSDAFPGNAGIAIGVDGISPTSQMAANNNGYAASVTSLLSAQSMSGVHYLQAIEGGMTGGSGNITYTGFSGFGSSPVAQIMQLSAQLRY